MNTDLARNDQETEIQVLPSKWTEEDFNAVKGSSGFLPYLALFIASSEPVKDGKVSMNSYALARGSDEFDELGKEIDVLIINRRPKALDLSDKDNIRSSFDPSSELFAEIKGKAQNVQNSRCMFGMEFLVWIPSRKEFATFFMGSSTARNESRRVNELLGRKCTLKSRKIESNQYTWFGPLATPCSAIFDMPELEQTIKVQEEFLNPREKTGAEVVKDNPTTVVER